MSIIGSELLYYFRVWSGDIDTTGGGDKRTEANGCTSTPPSYSGIGQKQGTLGYPYIHIYIHPHKKYTKEASKV
jgi:hypothetical protein